MLEAGELSRLRGWGLEDLGAQPGFETQSLSQTVGLIRFGFE